jgi:DNA modification methylase
MIAETFGSGTTIIAAERQSRSCYALEIDPTYTDVALKRWEAFTGQSATLEGDGRTFSEITEGRVIPADK